MALSEAPALIPYWFHSLESDSKHKETPNIRIEFSKNDSENLERAYQRLIKYDNGNGIEKPPETIDVMEDLLFEVNIPKRTLSPIYWKGKSYEVVRGTWFYATDMFKFLACDEELSRQIEEGYQQAQPWLMEPPKNNEKAKSTTIDFEDKRNYRLTGPYVGQCITYSGPNSAWLLSTNIASQLARAVMTKITNNENIGGTRLIRGYAEVEKWKKRNEEELQNKNNKNKSRSKSKKYSESEKENIKNITSSLEDVPLTKEPQKSNTEYSINNYKVTDNNEKDHRYEKIEHLVFVVHGIGEKFCENNSSSTIEQSVNDIRKTAKEVAELYFAKDKNQHQKGVPLPSFPTTSESAYKHIYVPKGTGVQFIPVNWRRQMNIDRYTVKRKRRLSNASVNLKKSLSNLEKKLEEEKSAEKKNNSIENEDKSEDKSNDNLKTNPSSKESLKVPSVNDSDDDDDEDDEIDELNFPRMEDILLESIPIVRKVVTDLALDVLFYMTPRHYQQMITILSNEFNRLYKLFKKHHPDFNGKVSLFGHSLGSQLCFDILCHQIPEVLNTEKVDIVNYNRLSPYGGEANYKFKQLDFPVENFFGVGSPVGLFTILSDRCIRFFDWKNPTKEGLTSNDVLVPIVKNWFNIFHPSDPVAHRIEPLVLKKSEYEKNDGETFKPNPIPYSKGGLTGTVREFQGIQKDLTLKGMRLFGNVYNVVQALIPNNDKSKSEESLTEKEFDNRDLKNININGRLDYAIQAQILDNQYLAAIPAHSSYWNDQDTIAFVLAELYRNMSFP
ncbi:DDHD-domain-containing protein [Piromyces finnis]|uniref:DDHD-domain-containing protein n=1 Tax=Piromyces finnis TaxID=1754191 RepID=A0A1Y1UYX1_9FUNG|nr:DDHD-domain-containing protein [Piromyces finnis]|eukprot:ORX43762.1 DDHD-domain-containing protein [Piromyces finnis]